MARSETPIIIRRKKVVAGGGHHGGAWKVAYADFVTAMMAFFLMMWLLNATSEDQRQGLADYFSPDIPLSRQSSGANNMLNGSFGASKNAPTEVRAELQDAEQEQIEEIARALDGLSGESEVADELLRHIRARVTDEGLVVDLFSLPGAPLFVGNGAETTPLLRDLVAIVDDIFRMARNPVAVQGHVRSMPVVRNDRNDWTVSAARAREIRELLATGWTTEERIARTTAFAAKKPLHPDRLDLRNDRVELILLRRQ